jgi:hypothetical protein
MSREAEPDPSGNDDLRKVREELRQQFANKIKSMARQGGGTTPTDLDWNPADLDWIIKLRGAIDALDQAAAKHWMTKPPIIEIDGDES